MRHRFFDLGLVLPAVCLLTIIGCGSLPKEEEAKAAVQKLVELFAQVKTLNKTDGCELTVMGQKAYKMSYEATVEITKDEKALNDYDHSSDVANMTFLSEYNNFTSRIGFVPSPQAIFPKVGQTFIIHGSVLFAKSERGWRCVSFE